MAAREIVAERMAQFLLKNATVAPLPQAGEGSCETASKQLLTGDPSLDGGFWLAEWFFFGENDGADAQKGQIMLKPVLRTIVNPGTSLLNLHTAGETLEATGGHVFWVSGQGWVKARQLQPKMRLHTLQGTVDLASIEAGGQQDTYNLVVADFHTYFVGRQRILTHDNTIRKPTNCVVSGLAAHIAAKSP
jgi:hypothetical protein